MSAAVRTVRWTAVKFGLFAVVSLLLLVLLVNTMVNGLGAPARTFTADFTDVSGLRTGDDVKVAGVRVGRVESISATDQGALVRFQLVDSQPIYDTTLVVMRYQNLVGQRYLELVPHGTSQTPLSPGATIDQSHTNPGFDLTALLNGFRPLFQVLQPADVNKLATSIVQVLQGEGGTVTQLLRETTSLTTFLADRDQLYGDVLTHLTPVLRDLAGQGGALRGTVVELEHLMAGLARDRGSLGRSIDSVSRLLGTGSRFLSDLRDPAARAVHEFMRTAGVLARTRSQLAAAISSFGLSLGALGRATSYENALNVYACQVLVQVGGHELDPAGAQGPYSKVCRP